MITQVRQAKIVSLMVSSCYDFDSSFFGTTSLNYSKIRLNMIANEFYQIPCQCQQKNIIQALQTAFQGKFT